MAASFRIAISAIVVVAGAKFQFSQQYRLSCTDSSCKQEDLDEFEFSLLQRSVDMKNERIKRSPAAPPQRTPSMREDFADPSNETKTHVALVLPTATSAGATQHAIMAKTPGSLMPSFPMDQTSSSGLLSNTSAPVSDADSKTNLLFKPWTPFTDHSRSKSDNHKQTLALTMISVSRSKAQIIMIIFVVVVVMAIGLTLVWSSMADSKNGGKAPDYFKRVGMGQSFVPPPAVRLASPNPPRLGLNTPSLGPQSQQSVGQKSDSWHKTPGATPDHSPVPPMPKAPPGTNPRVPLSPEDQRRLMVPQQPCSFASIPHLCPALILPNNDPALFKVSLSRLNAL